jgi:hypothetical protein
MWNFTIDQINTLLRSYNISPNLLEGKVAFDHGSRIGVVIVDTEIFLADHYIKLKKGDVIEL